ncbi:MAG: AIR synthase family protein, partial [Methanomassiliicoccales archaeon]|nr:AIR synthase family protein [Methanomassiliicoccales archaeon]
MRRTSHRLKNRDLHGGHDPYDQGKADYRLFRSISKLTGSKRSDVLLGPMFGADFGVIDTGNGRVLAISTDPIYINQQMELDDAAWFAFHIVVTDVALSGLAPSHLALDWNLPPGLDDSIFLTISRVFHAEAKALNMSIVTGHTGRYGGCKAPILGAGTSIAVGRKENLILPTGMRAGDRLILTKYPALETAILLSYEFDDLLRENVGGSTLTRLRKKIRMLSPLNEAAVVSSAGGVSAMHDASERGIYGALHELSKATGLSFTIEPDNIAMDSDVKKVADFLRFNPLESSSEGTLILTAREERVPQIVRKLASAGVRASVCGTVIQGRNCVAEVTDDGRLRAVGMPLTDGYLIARHAAKRILRTAGSNSAHQISD